MVNNNLKIFNKFAKFPKKRYNLHSIECRKS
jgi:hypothetical protein